MGMIKFNASAIYSGSKIPLDLLIISQSLAEDLILYRY